MRAIRRREHPGESMPFFYEDAVRRWRTVPFVWDDGHHRNATLNSFKFPGDSVWPFESFTRESVVLRRRDSSPRYTATCSGRISSDGNSLVDGTINGSRNPFMMTWGPPFAGVSKSADEPRANMRATLRFEPSGQPPHSVQAQPSDSLNDLIDKVTSLVTATNGDKNATTALGNLKQIRDLKNPSSVDSSNTADRLIREFGKSISMVAINAERTGNQPVIDAFKGIADNIALAGC